MKIIKEEKGSITLFVLIAMLFFVVYLVGMYMLSTNSESCQIAEITRIKEIYELGVQNIDDVYETIYNDLEHYVTYTINNIDESKEYYVHDITMSLANNTTKNVDTWEIYLKNDDVIDVNCDEANYDITEEKIKLWNTETNSEITAKSKISFNMKINTTKNNYIPIIETVNMKYSQKQNEIPIQIAIQETNSWTDSEFIYQMYEIKIKKIEDIEISGWKFNINMQPSSEIQSVWNANYTILNNKYTFENKDYNGSIQLDSEVVVGFIMRGSIKQVLEIKDIQVFEKEG